MESVARKRVLQALLATFPDVRVSACRYPCPLHAPHRHRPVPAAPVTTTPTACRPRCAPLVCAAIRRARTALAAFPVALANAPVSPPSAVRAMTRAIVLQGWSVLPASETV